MKIVCDTSRQFQIFEGFGASGAWWAQLVGGWEQTDLESNMSVRDRISQLLFSKESGIGLDIYRYNIGGGSSQSGKGLYSQPLRRTESFDTDTGYDWNRDKNAVYMMRRAVFDGVSDVVFFVNSPIERLTKNGMAHTDPHKPFAENLSKEKYLPFAKYCLDVTEHFIKSGIPVKYLSPINEPLWKWTGGQEGCHYRPKSITKVFRVFCSEIQKYEFLSSLKFSGAENGDIRWFNKTYTRCLLRDKKVRERLDGVDIHSYCMSAFFPMLNNRVAYLKRFRHWMDKHYPGVPIKMSEWTHMKGGRDSGMDSALVAAKTIYEDITILNVTSWQHWIAVSEVDYCDGLIYINLDNKSFQITKRFYATGNFSKYIKRGARRVYCDCEDKTINVLAFLNENETVIIVINPNSSDKEISIDIPNLYKATHILTDETRSLEESLLEDTDAIIIPAKSINTIILSEAKT